MGVSRVALTHRPSAGLAERLAGSEPIDAQTFNSACFMLSRALEELALSVPEAAPLAKCLLRVAGRVVIDSGQLERFGVDPGAVAVPVRKEHRPVRDDRARYHPVGLNVADPDGEVAAGDCEAHASCGPRCRKFYTSD